MSSLRPAVGALVRAATRTTTASTAPSVRTTLVRQQQQFSTSNPARGSHGSQYDPPTGWLFGVKPGEKYKPEGWENLFFYGFCGSLAVFAVVYAFKPDTSIQTWALEEARRRLEAEGILPDPEKKE